MRRLRVALVVALGLTLGLAVLIIGGGTLFLRSARGGEWVRAEIEASLQGALGARGSAHVGAIRLAPIGTVAVDSVVVRDADGALVLGTGRVSGEVDLWPLTSRVAQLRNVEVDRPEAHLVQDRAGHWNISQLFVDSLAIGSRKGGPAAWRVVLDSLTVRNGTLTTVRPARDTGVVRARYRSLSLALGRSQFDNGTGAGHFVVQHLAVTSDAPPVVLQHAAGSVDLWQDSLRFDFPLVRLPATVARLDGGLRWDARAPAQRLAVTIRSDSIGFSDIAWITSLVPTEGRGRARVRITDGLADGAMRYAIDSLDASAAASRLRGGFTAEVGETVAIRALDMRAEPLDFALVHELFGDSVPAPPWDGVVRGRLRATGGPLARWRIDPSTLEFEDRRAGGARSRLTISGVLDLTTTPTRFAPLDVVIDSLDVRAAGAVVTRADSLHGFLTGAVRLVGPLDDYAFSALDLTHVDGAKPRTVVRGSGRIATDTTRTWLEGDLAFERLGLAALGPVLSAEPLRGTAAGRLTVRARGDSVALEAAFTDGDAHLTFRGATTLDTARLVVLGEAAVERFDANRYLAQRKLPAHRLTGGASLGVDGTWTEPAGPLDITLDSTSQVGGLAISDARAVLTLEPGGLTADTLIVAAPLGHLSARGRLSRERAPRDTLRFEATIDSMALVRGFLPDSLAAAWADSLGGRARLSGLAFGSLDTLDLRVEWQGTGLQAGGTRVDSASGEALLLGLPAATRGLASFDATRLVLGGVPIAWLASEMTVRDPTWADASIRLVAGDTLVATARADVRWTADSMHVRLDSLDATSRGMAWHLEQPALLEYSPAGLALDSLRLRSTDGARLDVVAALDSAGPVRGSLHARRVPLAHFAFTGLMPPDVAGRVTFDAELAGTRRAPTLQSTGSLDSVRVENVPAPNLGLRANYDRRMLDIELRGRSADTASLRDAFLLTAALPLDLTLESRTLAQRKLPEDVFIRFVADGSPLAGLEAVLPGVHEIRGGFDADLLVSGRWGALEPRGVFLLRDGAFAVPSLRTGFRDVLMDVALTPDSVIFHRVRLEDEHATGDTASLEGAFYRTGTKWHADIRTYARNLRVIDDPNLAEADASWQLRLRGVVDSLVLGGEITVPTANAFIGRQRAVLDVSTEAPAPSVVSRYVPRIDDLTIRLGNEVRLRSAEANVQLTGDVAVTGTLSDPSARGEIQATRGTYRLDLGPLQRTFHVDSGVVRLNGPLDIPPALDIHTSYLVRQADREDVTIGARLTGTVREPRLVLSSADLGSTASETEIISYLLFGSPSFALDNNGTWAVRTATAALVPSLGGAVERALGGRIPFISELQVTTVAGNSPTDFTLNSFEGLLNSLALTAGSQVGTDSYLNVSAGVCRGENRAASSLARWFGVAVEYRPREKLSAVLSLNPGSAPCNRVGTFSQIYQFGLDLYRDWRW
ncbi:MAG: translocation/assembly module TamB domain-containing protein [Gemmatimonadota bacterium]|nr:translocation/assembly module TamB domain-containing protein [Gemmatimonadota bacterium]